MLLLIVRVLELQSSYQPLRFLYKVVRLVILCQNMQNIILYHSFDEKTNFLITVKSDDRSVTPFFYRKVAVKNAVNRSVFVRFWWFFCQVQFCGFCRVNAMHIQNRKKFIEIIARNPLKTKKDIWLWFSRIHCDDAVIHVGGAIDGQAKSNISSDHAVKTGLKYPLLLTTSQQHYVVI